MGANIRIERTALLPFRPYDRSGISCIFKKDMASCSIHLDNIALGHVMQAYLDGYTGKRHMINRLMCLGNDVGLSQESIRSLIWPDPRRHSRNPHLSSYPIQACLELNEGINLKVADEQLQQPVLTGRMFGPFLLMAGKTISQVNYRIEANKNLQATGFS